MGHLGFITEFSKEDIFIELEKALKGLLDIAKIGLYKVEIREEDKTVGSGLFLNDAVFQQKRYFPNDQPIRIYGRRIHLSH